MYHEDGQEEVFKVTYCVQNPIYLALTPLDEVALATPPLDPDASLWAQMEHRVTRMFKCNYGRMATAADAKPVSPSRIWILPALRHEGGVHVSTKTQEIPLMQLITGVDVMIAGEEPPEKKAKNADDHYETCLKEHPWLEHLDASKGFSSEAASGSQTQDSGGGRAYAAH